ncbi:MAG TPA: hypothetical protein PKZ39_01360, partial [Clostridia bacterium]|nr:hypothetical protein [Clostridia bacterium]
ILVSTNPGGITYCLILSFIASLRRVFCHPAVSVNLNVAKAMPSVSFLAGQYNPSPLWMQTSFTSALKTMLCCIIRANNPYEKNN